MGVARALRARCLDGASRWPCAASIHPTRGARHSRLSLVKCESPLSHQHFSDISILAQDARVHLGSTFSDGASRWAEMIKRAYEVDPLVCARCGGEMRIIAFIVDPAVIDKILRHLVAKGDHRVRGPPGWALC
ncbi:MAG: hypothetical protein IFK91_10015 [Acidobacteria bacterium]|nr:hypothetical protein [Candidatus Sulfomarinibacter sp. MAG AM1]